MVKAKEQWPTRVTFRTPDQIGELNPLFLVKQQNNADLPTLAPTQTASSRCAGANNNRQRTSVWHHGDAANGTRTSLHAPNFYN
jgi:hypothetical protein